MTRIITIKDRLYEELSQIKGKKSFSEIIESFMNKEKGICGSNSEPVEAELKPRPPGRFPDDIPNDDYSEQNDSKDRY